MITKQAKSIQVPVPKKKAKPLIPESDSYWKTIHTLMIKKSVETKSKIMRDDEVHINPNNGLGY